MFSALSGPFGPTLGAPNSAGGSAPVITSPSFLVAGTVGTLYPTTTFTATGTAPITWSIVSGTLPTGMSFSSGGVLSGTPTVTASGSITFRATNAYGFDDRALTLTVNAASVVANTMSLSLPTGTATNYPYQFGRVFKQGVIANYPQILIDGVAQTTQADVKNRWPDGSVKFAVLSLVVPSLNTSLKTLTFQNQASGNNTPETKANMLANYDFNCTINATNGGTPITGAPVAARTILNAISDATLASNTSGDSPNSRYWTQGPICTTVILCDHTAKTYDFGLDAYKCLRPIFHVQFWPTLSKYKVRCIVEGSDVAKLQDQTYDVSLSTGNASPATVYTRSTIPQSCGTRWTKTFWSGAALPSINADHNANYLANTKVIPYYDPLSKLSPATITSLYATWGSAAKDIYDPGYYLKFQQAPGGRPEIALINQWSTDALLAGDYRTDDISDTHAALAMAWPMHFREGSNTKLYDSLQTLPAIGCPVSLFARPTVQMGDDNLYTPGYLYGSWNVSAVDAYIWIAWGAPPTPGNRQTPGATPTNNNGWGPFSDHVPQPFYASYLTSGEYVWLEQMQFWASWAAFDAGLTNNGFYGRGPTLTNAGLPGDTRRQGWIFRNRAAAAAFSLDNSKEKAYYTYLINDAITIAEGIRAITGSGNEGSAAYIWGTTTGRADMYGGLGVSPLGIFSANQGGTESFAATYGYLWNGVSRAQGPWQDGYNIIAFAFARDLGFDTTRILTWYATSWNTAFSVDSTAWMLSGNFVIPIATTTPLENIATWPSAYSKFKPLAQIVAEGHPLDPSMPQNPASYTYGYPEYYSKWWNNSADSPGAYNAAAIAMIYDLSGVAANWNWITTNLSSIRTTQPASRWRILPRP